MFPGSPKPLLLATALILSGPLTGAQAQGFDDGDMFYVMPVHPSADPWDFSDAVSTCLTEDGACQSAVQAVGAEVDLSLDAIAEMADQSAAMGWETTFRHVDEQFWQRFESPDGYVICSLFVSTSSLSPESGDLSAYLSLQADQTRVSVYNFIHATKDGEDPTQYDGVVTLHLKPGAPSDRPDCDMQTSDGKQARYACQGLAEFGGEYPVCTSDPVRVTPKK